MVQTAQDLFGTATNPFNAANVNNPDTGAAAVYGAGP